MVRPAAEVDDKRPESVHLCNYPKSKKITSTERKLLEVMEDVREIASLGQAARVDSGIKVRQPLAKLKVRGLKLKTWMKEVLKHELNVKEVSVVKNIQKKSGLNIQESKSLKVGLNTSITDDLKKEGLLRELARAVQDARKKLGFKQEDKVTVSIDTENNEIQDLIKEMNEDLKVMTNSKEITIGKGAFPTKVNGEKIKLSITN